MHQKTISLACFVLSLHCTSRMGVGVENSGDGGGLRGHRQSDDGIGDGGGGCS